MRFFVDLRKNAEMAQEIDRAIACLTPDNHTEAVRIMNRAGVPIPVVSRVVFGKERLRGRRRDIQTAQVFDRALALTQTYGKDDAATYLTLKSLTARLVARLLSDGPHRGDPEWQAQWITPSPEAPADQPQRLWAGAEPPSGAEVLVTTLPQRPEVMTRPHGIRRLRRVCAPCAALLSMVRRVVNWLRPPRAF